MKPHHTDCTKWCNFHSTLLQMYAHEACASLIRDGWYAQNWTITSEKIMILEFVILIRMYCCGDRKTEKKVLYSSIKIQNMNFFTDTLERNNNYLTTSTSEGVEWGRWGWSRFLFLRSPIAIPQFYIVTHLYIYISGFARCSLSP